MTVSAPGPSPGYVITPTGEKIAPYTATFTDTTTSAVPIASWFWDFGDGTNSTEANPSHTYTAIGTYLVNLTVTNVLGTQSFATQTLTTVPQPRIYSYFGDDSPSTGTSSGSSVPAANLQTTGQLAPTVPSSVTQVSSTGQLASTPFSVDFAGMPGVTVSWITTIIDIPAVDAHMTTMVQPFADASTTNAFTTAFHLVGLDINNLAYVMIVQKSGITETGPATVRMSVPAEWVVQNGGNTAIVIVRMDDNGVTEVLPTSFSGYDPTSGYPVFSATSQHGLSTWGLVAVKPYTQPAVSGQLAPTQAPADTTMQKTSATTTSGGLWPVMGVGGALGALAIIGVALLIYFRRNKGAD